MREEIARFLKQTEGSEFGASALSGLVQLATARLVQEAVEREQTHFVGRERYARTGGRGQRSGYVPGHVDTAQGRVALAIFQVRDAGGPYRSALYDFLRGHSDVVERLAAEMYARRRSTRDVKAAFTDEVRRCLLSRCAVSELTERLWAEYEAFRQRSLVDIPVLPVFWDGVYEPLRVHGVARQAVLVAWAITLEGRKVLLSVALGNRESHEGWRQFLRGPGGAGADGDQGRRAGPAAGD